MTRPVLSATKAMADARLKSELHSLLEAYRFTLGDEARSRTGLGAKLRSAGEKLERGEYGYARERLSEIGTALQERREAAQVKAGVQESAALAAGRGIETVPSERGPSTRDGLQWLVSKGRLTPVRQDAGERYGRLWIRAKSDGVRSCLNHEGGGSGTGPGDARQRAQRALGAVDRHIAVAVGQAQGERLVQLLVQVCGQGKTLREVAQGDDRAAQRLEADLMIALDMVGAHLGLVRVAA